VIYLSLHLNTRPGFRLETFVHDAYFTLTLADTTGASADLYLDVESADRLIEAIKEGRDQLERKQLEASCERTREASEKEIMEGYCKAIQEREGGYVPGGSS
jgi:hypothetical protein